MGVQHCSHQSCAGSGVASCTNYYDHDDLDLVDLDDHDEIDLLDLDDHDDLGLVDLDDHHDLGLMALMVIVMALMVIVTLNIIHYHSLCHSHCDILQQIL